MWLIYLIREFHLVLTHQVCTTVRLCVHTDLIKIPFPHLDAKLTWKWPTTPYPSLPQPLLPALLLCLSLHPPLPSILPLPLPFLLFLLTSLSPFPPPFYPVTPFWMITDLTECTDFSQIYLKAIISKSQPSKACQQIPQRMTTLVPGRIARRDSHLSQKLSVLGKVLTQVEMRPSWGTMVLGLYTENIIRFPEPSTKKYGANKNQEGVLLATMLDTKSSYLRTWKSKQFF